MRDSDPPTVAPPVSPGDRVAVLSPASGGGDRFPHPYERGLRLLRERFDLEPVAFPTATRSSEWLSDHPEARARDVERAFRDPDIGAVVATIGGNDQVRVLKHLDGDVLADNPTRFFGSSDNTHLHSLLWEREVVSYYGGMVLTTLGTAVDRFPEASEWLSRALFEPSFGDLSPAAEWTDHDPDWFAADYHETDLEREPGEWEWRGGTGRGPRPAWILAPDERGRGTGRRERRVAARCPDDRALDAGDRPPPRRRRTAVRRAPPRRRRALASPDRTGRRACGGRPAHLSGERATR